MQACYMLSFIKIAQSKLKLLNENLFSILSNSDLDLDTTGRKQNLKLVLMQACYILSFVKI